MFQQQMAFSLALIKDPDTGHAISPAVAALCIKPEGK
jgi:hypothetical protein